MARRTNLTNKKGWKHRFIKALATNAHIGGACASAGISRTSVYEARGTDLEFAAAWDEAIEQSIEALEQVARDRAVAGSDTLTIFLLKAQRPHVYRERLTVDIDAEVARTLSQLAAFGEASVSSPPEGTIGRPEGETERP
jgi:hypothetical protein